MMASQGNSILNDIKREFKKDNMINKLIMINIGVYIAVGLAGLIGFFVQGQLMEMNPLVKFLAVPAQLKQLALKPWAIVTYMFLHEGFFHILFNMLWLFWIGRILQEYIGKKKVFPIYFWGGIAGAFLYILIYNLAPAFKPVLPDSYALGASAGVMAVVIATATLLPDYSIRLLFLGGIKLKWLALAFVVIDLISIPKGNAGGHIAHLGGAILGYVFIKQLQAGNDWSKGLNRFIDSLSNLLSGKKSKLTFEKSTKTKATYNRPKRRKVDGVSQDKVDAILDKISRSGYDSLTKEEKEYLFKASNQT